MSEELQDEATSINAIYGDETFASIEPNIFALSLPSQTEVSLRIEFPKDYPDAPPSILGTQSVGNDVAKGAGSTIVELARTILSEVYTPGSPCIFDLIEELNQRLRQLSLDASSKNEEQQTSQANGQDLSYHDPARYSVDDEQHVDDLSDPPPWTLSDIVTEKKSIFIARAAPVESVEQAKSYLSHLLATDKKVAKATHNITAWRIRRDDGVQYQDCDDDGEDAAGGRLLHLLELMNAWGVMVVVSRWYGGIKLGPDRFRLINQCARDAVVKGGFGPTDDAKDHGKKKGKK
ncbi:hypothetical protein M409DRAFT_62439 [Zasmidium cellare ATCC 36951]|uniref:RWD domain-containing protein n=1 Tax=Zasmidium cellare ATCC 36951 TaxID=1080233 RepID=A0A6A6D4Z0_ZASCE|nr:uncharacterized protein M409DRAFT_62439 [Zasmidium cellare ATCC 36951]KAF2172716.1 hypothetical protein M409DRAFT_62439 [Zasmidium cellare ATCC 36951]